MPEFLSLSDLPASWAGAITDSRQNHYSITINHEDRQNYEKSAEPAAYEECVHISLEGGHHCESNEL